jgi:hypothetical protein
MNTAAFGRVRQTDWLDIEQAGPFSAYIATLHHCSTAARLQLVELDHVCGWHETCRDIRYWSAFEVKWTLRLISSDFR